MKITCPQCKNPIRSSDLNLEAGVAACKSCDIGFYLNQKPQVSKEKIDDNHGLAIKRSGLGTMVEYSWRKGGGYWFLLFFALFWNGIVFFVFGAAGERILEEALKEPFMFVFLLHPTVGIVIGYYVLCKIINKTTLLVERGKIWVKIGPLWWPGSKELITHDISQVYVEKYVAYKQNNQPAYRYKAKVIIAGVHEDLMKGLPNYNDALKVEQIIEEALSIDDEIVDSEHQGQVS